MNHFSQIKGVCTRVYGILMLCTLLLSGCRMRSEKLPEVRPIAVEVLTMTEQTVVPRHTYIGEIEEKSSLALSSQTAGRITEVNVGLGSRVRAGQVLLSIDSTQAVNARLSAEAMLRQAEDGYARACAIYKEGGLTEQKRVEIESQLAQARSMYASAAQLVAECRVTAPVSGVVSELRAKAGETTVPGVPLLTIMNIEGFVVRFAVPEQEIAHIRTGDSATTQVEAAGINGLPVVVTDKSLVPNRLAHSYEVTAALGNRTNAAAQLLPGMMCKVTLEADCISGYMLPQSCIQLLPEGAKVWVAREGVAQRIGVTVGQYVSGGVLITEGLESGDQVIIKGYQKLWQGAAITY